jgi:tetratricopeptide (TPR) repeat protein
MPYEDALTLIGQESARKDVSLTADEQENLWQRTDGVPLAVVWSIGLMGLGGSVESVLRRLGSGQSDIARFCFEESMAQIRERDAQQLLLALALFVDDASREALGVVAGLGEDDFGRDTGLEELLRLSLVNKVGERFSLLPLTRSFVVSEGVAQNHQWGTSAKERLRAYYYQLVKDFGSWSSDWRGHDRVERELPNLLAIVDDARSAVRYHETIDNGQQVDQTSVPLVQWLLEFIPRIARTCRIRGYWDECQRLCVIAVELARDIGETSRIGWRYYDLARINQYRGDLESAQRWASQALAQWQREEYIYGVCQARRILGLAALRSGDLATAHELITSAFEEYLHDGSQAGLPHFLGSLAELAEREGDLERARSLYQQAVDTLRQDDNTPYLASDLRNLGRVLFATGAVADAHTCLAESLLLAQECGRADVMAKTYYQLAIVYEHDGQPQSAMTNARQALDLFRRLGMKGEQAEAEVFSAKLAEGLPDS